MKPFESVLLDLRHAVRTIARMPLLASVIVISLGVGIGVNTTVFSWAQMMLFQPLPGVRGAASLQLVEPRSETGAHPGMSWPEFRDIQERVPALEHLFASRMIPMNLGEPPRTERAYGQLVSGNYFSALGLTPARGRFIAPDEAKAPGDAPVVVISWTFWQHRFGGSEKAVGSQITLNGRPLTIVGVAPERFQGTILGLSFDLWAPATMAPVLLNGSTELSDRDARGYAVMGRLAPGRGAAAAQAELDAAMKDLALTYPRSNASVGADLLSFWKSPRGPQKMLLTALVVLQAVMILLLVTVCGNTANLVFARASARQREIGLRRVLGAGRWRVVSLLLTENLLLALLGAGLGVAIAVWGTNALRAAPMITSFPIRFQTEVNGMTLLFAATLGIACGLVFGVVPAVQLTRMDPHQALRAGFSTATRSTLRHALMGVQVGMALVVLLVAGLFLRSFNESRTTDPGFRVRGLLLGAYDLSPRNADTTAARLFAARLLERLAALPDVEAAAIATQVPLDIHGMPLRGFVLEGRARQGEAPDRAISNVVTPGYFATMGIAVLSGRDFAALTDAAAPPQAIVNEEFVRRYLDGGEPLGRRIRGRATASVIVGVVRNSLYDAFGEPAQPIVYYSFRDRPAGFGEIHVRSRSGHEAALGADVQRVVRGLDASLPVYDVRTMSEHIDKNLFLRRIPARMFAVLGPLLLVLAAIAIYAVVAYAVAQRTNEIGIRLALGASAHRVVTQIMRESMQPAFWGAGVGWVLALLVQMHAGRGRPIPALIYGGVPLVLLAVAAFACWVPARRATRIDPMVALRRE